MIPIGMNYKILTANLRIEKQMGTILRANLITVTTLDKWKAVFVNSFSAGAIYMY